MAVPKHIVKIITKAKEKQLKHLYLSNTVIFDDDQLTEIPIEVFNLSQLEELDLSDNKLTTVPESIGKLTNLTQLDLSINKLTTVPESIGKLTNLTQLDLSGNELTTVPESLTKLTQLTQLDLSVNELTTVPESLTKLTNLTQLDLSFNELTTVPESLTKLTNLTELYLSDNQLTTVPESLTKLTNLTLLDLSDNQLTTVPESLTKLTNLTELYLSDNQLTTVPESLTKLTNLTELDLMVNPLETPPIEIVKNGIEAIRDYFRQLLEEGKDYIYEAKLLIVGEAGAGKTTLAKKIEKPDYQLQQNEKTTEGIDIIQWEFPLENGRDFRVNIWDFGGQEIYHATHQFFLTKRSLYTLVADTRKEDTDFYYWLNIVELLSDNSPLLIIKNEKQDRHREINERALRGQFTNLKETLATNLATNRGLEDILTQIKFYISNLPHIKEAALPRTWKQVREALEEDSRNHISLDEYLNICSNNGFTLYNDKLQLSGYLHDLGVCLHFQDDPLLKKTVIIKPEWGTYAVYKVLDNNQVIRNLGRFNRADLEKIWSEEKYAYMQDELLQLMMKFQLCYPIPGSEYSYIAPQLLSLNQPEYDWDESDNLILRYTYEFMPKGIITRFIVVMDKWIYQQQYVWKSGVILNKDNTKAEVIEYYEKREIKIRVTGRHKRDLLTTVTYELDQIHKSYNRLKCSKFIPCNCSTCKNSQNPHFYEFDQLRERIAYGKDTIECGSPPYNTVKVLRLIDDVIDLKQFTKDEQLDIYRQLKKADPSITINIEATGSKTMSEKSEIKVGDGSTVIGAAGRDSNNKNLEVTLNESPTEKKWNLSNKLALMSIIATLFVGLGAWLFGGLLNDKVMEWFSPDPATQQEQLDES
ncbi:MULTISPECIES: COR domain-containing protein [Moorena]|uniref:non-specific serine/threonine protein kinase n=1 Tax=Moorena producens 3L TaxID=489825 RepID=F4XZM4_9CYAN|nr:MULTISPECIES: COR domain-containing protein [Moorena]EGJ30029.1 Leucine Rich Repeat, Miro-like protein [Moorena producens 3L]NEP64410.1 leucine-rich repeat protein [Moorena sp. SIO3A5]OLT68501.1 GTPase [Moorena producens 3L]